MKFYCIADEDTVRGFRLAGIPGQVVTNPQEAAAALAAASAHSDLGILILTQSVAVEIRQQLDAIRLGQPRPLIVEIPGPEGPLPGHKSLRQVVQEAVGIHLGQGEGS